MSLNPQGECIYSLPEICEFLHIPTPTGVTVLSEYQLKPFLSKVKSVFKRQLLILLAQKNLDLDSNLPSKPFLLDISEEIETFVEQQEVSLNELGLHEDYLIRGERCLIPR